MKVLEMNYGYIHYGHDHFDPELMRPIKNECGYGWCKPSREAGLWASPNEQDFYTWKEWCEDEQFNLYNLKTSFCFRIKNPSRILEVGCDKESFIEFIRAYSIANKHHWHKTVEDVCNAIENNDFIMGSVSLDFEKMASDGYAGIFFHFNRLTYYTMYGWDCDSLLIWDPNEIIAE